MQHWSLIHRLLQFFRGFGRIDFGFKLATGIVALALSSLCFLGVLAFHFPESLTTLELRRSYEPESMRQLMYWSMVVAGAFSLWNVVFSRARWMAGLAFAMLAVTLALGGTEVQLGYFPDDKRYVGLDWFFLDFLGSTLIFVFIEKLFALRAQPLFRSHGQTDAQHFFGQPSGGGLCCARD